MSRALDVLMRFLALGFVSFGGPGAHLGYFRTTFVDRLKWIDDAGYARLVALGQFLPGPGSSQVGFALGLHRAGLVGGLAAFLGFTAPSFLLMYLLSVAAGEWADTLVLRGAFHGFKLLAVVVVADAVTGMFRAFCRGPVLVAVGLVTAAVLWFAPSLATQFAVLGGAALIGAALIGAGLPATARDGDAREAPEIPAASEAEATEVSVAPGTKPVAVPLLLFLALFVLTLSPLRAWLSGMAPFADFYQAGSLVFGGGHVVLPLLQQQLGGAVSTERFLLGYSAAQAVPGPMFTLSTFLGAELAPGAALRGAALATAGIFLPGFLLVLGLRGAWERLLAVRRVAGSAAGLNAAVVGLLLATWMRTIVPSAVAGPLDLLAVAVGWFVLRYAKAPLVAMVAGFGVAGLLLEWLPV